MAGMDASALRLREMQVDYLTAKSALGNVAGAASVPLLLMERAGDDEMRATCRVAYGECARAMVALERLTAALGEEMARRQGEHGRTTPGDA